MLDIIVIMMLLMAIIFMLYAFSVHDPTTALLAAVLWLLIALMILQGIEVPYEFYDSGTSTVITGTHNITDNLMYLAYVFMCLAVVMFISCITYIFEAAFGKNNIDKRNH